MNPDPACTLDEILAELPKLSCEDRRRILERIPEIDDEAESVEIARRTADEAFQMLDAMEAGDTAGQSHSTGNLAPEPGMSRLEEEWDNPEDAVYDDWRKLYGV